MLCFIESFAGCSQSFASLRGGFFLLALLIGSEYYDYREVGMLMTEYSGIRLENNIPIPEGRVSRRYPHEDMEVGDSFFIAGVALQVVLNANWRAGKRYAKKFIARKEGEGVRVWRTA
jgi:hypothetical protein